MSTTAKKHTDDKPLTTTMEDYLEVIYDLDHEKKVVRVKDIASRMAVKMPTVTSMLRALNERRLVNYEKHEYVRLTDEGAGVGKEMRRRHGVIFKFLKDILKIDAPVADGEACKMEHTLSAATFERLTDFMEFIQTCPKNGENWLNAFEEFRKTEFSPDKCEACLDGNLCRNPLTAMGLPADEGTPNP